MQPLRHDDPARALDRAAPALPASQGPVRLIAPGRPEDPGATGVAAKTGPRASMPVPRHPEPRGGREVPLAAALLARGLVGADALLPAMARSRTAGLPLRRILLARGLVSAADLVAVDAELWHTRAVDLEADPPDPRLIARVGATRCLKLGILPWRRAGGAVVVVTARPQDFARHHNWLRARFGPVSMALAEEDGLRRAVLRLAGGALVARAETRVPADESCRNLGRPAVRRWAVGLICAFVAAAVALPQAVFTLAAGWAVLTLALTSGLKAAACIGACRDAATPTAARQSRPASAQRGGGDGIPKAVAATADGPETRCLRDLPRISLIVPLYCELHIADRLIRRLRALDYPRERLEIFLAVEQDDPLTRAALRDLVLPPWVRVVPVPRGTIRTKPRALNYLLACCTGEIVGVYDAEDAPAADQLHRVAAHFDASPAKLACVQGALDFYNTGANWMARCFTLEYATWFRVILPGLVRLGAPIPLGGTTLFFRRAALEALGGWDAHNVTEDADLGIRLARHGYRCELLQSVTHEEANCRPRLWVNQRSRWIKGYMMTWAVHMRNPARLWRDLGGWRFTAVQILFLGSLSQVLLAPLLWGFWLALLGLWHPFAVFPAPVRTGILGLFLGAEAISLATALIAARRAGHDRLAPWILMQGAYFPLATIAAYKAAYEMIARPFAWSKTPHGLIRDRRRRLRPAQPLATRADGISVSEPRLRRFSGGSRKPGKYAA